LNSSSQSSKVQEGAKEKEIAERDPIQKNRKGGEEMHMHEEGREMKKDEVT